MSLESILELIGIAAFAVFGAMAAMENGMDIFGVLVISVVTAMGGGFIRDLILNELPPIMFTHPIYVTVASITALAVVLGFNFLRIRQPKDAGWQSKLRLQRRIHFLLTLCDAIGLGVFTIVGVDIAVSRGFGDNAFFVLFTAVMTGTGGGVMRDIMLSRQPLLFKKEIYALAALAGAVLYYVSIPYVPTVISYYACTVLIVVIRMVSVVKNINLPSVPEIRAASMTRPAPYDDTPAAPSPPSSITEAYAQKTQAETPAEDDAHRGFEKDDK